MCVCTHMCVGVYIYTHTHTCVGAHTHVCIHVRAYIQLIVSHMGIEYVNRDRPVDIKSSESKSHTSKKCY